MERKRIRHGGRDRGYADAGREKEEEEETKREAWRRRRSLERSL